jgi:hypothetical protein
MLGLIFLNGNDCYVKKKGKNLVARDSNVDWTGFTDDRRYISGYSV